MKKFSIIAAVVLIIICTILYFVSNMFYNLALSPDNNKDKVFESSHNAPTKKFDNTKINNDNNKFKEKAEIFAWCDSLFITFGVLFGIGILSLLSSFGAFDLIGYSFANIFSVIINKDKKKYVDAIDYRDKRVEKNRKTRWSFFVYLGISLLFLIAALAIYIYIRYTYNY